MRNDRQCGIQCSLDCNDSRTGHTVCAVPRSDTTSSLLWSTDVHVFMPSPEGQSGTITLSVCPSVRLLPNLWTDCFEKNELILMQIDKSGPQGKSIKRSTLGATRSKVKVTRRPKIDLKGRKNNLIINEAWCLRVRMHTNTCDGNKNTLVQRRYHT